MSLMPKRTKFRKVHRGRLKGEATRGNRVAFGDLPAAAQDSFRRDHPRATVTDVAVQDTPAGVPWYRVVYKQDGLPAEATYRADGSIVTPEVANYVTRAPEPTQYW